MVEGYDAFERGSSSVLEVVKASGRVGMFVKLAAAILCTWAFDGGASSRVHRDGVAVGEPVGRELVVDEGEVTVVVEADPQRSLDAVDVGDGAAFAG